MDVLSSTLLPLSDCVYLFPLVLICMLLFQLLKLQASGHWVPQSQQVLSRQAADSLTLKEGDDLSDA